MGGQLRGLEFMAVLPKHNSPDIFFLCQARAVKDTSLVGASQTLEEGKTHEFTQNAEKE